jgi:hypothetical protein
LTATWGSYPSAYSTGPAQAAPYYAGYPAAGMGGAWPPAAGSPVGQYGSVLPPLPGMAAGATSWTSAEVQGGPPAAWVPSASGIHHHQQFPTPTVSHAWGQALPGPRGGVIQGNDSGPTQIGVFIARPSKLFHGVEARSKPKPQKYQVWDC